MLENYLQEFNVIGVDIQDKSNSKNSSYNFIKTNLCDLPSLLNIFANYQIDYVLHCAAQIYGVRGFHLFPADILSNNLVSTSNLLKCSVKHNIKKFAFISSSMVYETATEFPLKEEFTESISMPITGYGYSKLSGERLIQSYNDQYKLPYVIWRPFNIVTPLEQSEPEPGLAHVMADFIKKIYIDKNDCIEIFGNGEQVRCFSYIDDIAKIVASKSFDETTSNQIYNLGSETPTKIIDLAKSIFKKSKRSDQFKVKFTEIFDSDVQFRIPDCTKAKSIGFLNTKNIEELVDMCIKHYQ
jgi:UDP-glucose 4-epimerase